MKEETPIYCISGLGATCELYKNIDIGRPMNFIEWVEPAAEESMSDYCARLCDQIKHSGPITLIGCSFGGLATLEIAKRGQVEKAILISSIKTIEEKPAFFKLMSRVPLYKIQNKAIAIKSLPIWGRWFGMEDEEDKAFYLKNMETFSDNYMAWAIKQLSKWEAEEPNVKTYHIHGDKDLIFPLKYITDATVVKGGNHSMIVKRADEISNYIKDILALESRTAQGA